MDILTQLRILYLLLLAPLVFITSTIFSGLIWASMWGEWSDKHLTDKWAFRIIFGIAILITGIVLFISI